MNPKLRVLSLPQHSPILLNQVFSLLLQNCSQATSIRGIVEVKVQLYVNGDCVS